MSVLTACLLGIIQGLTEFLPVSSSGHLVLFQKIFHVTEPALFFDTMVHVGTLAAVIAVLWRDVWSILRRPAQPLAAYLIIATIPAVIFALVFKDIVETAFESGAFLGFAFLATAALLIIAELLSPRRATQNEQKNADTMNWLDALVIGILQAIAIVPGISRSGATLSGALSRKLTRDFAARFSFLLSIPAILGALALQLKDLLAGGAAETAGSIGAAALAAGTACAALTGFFAMRLMLKIVREKSLVGFAVYTGALGLLVLVDQFFLRVVF